MTPSKGAQTFIKVEGEKFAYLAVNVIETKDGFLEFDRVNSKSNEVMGHIKINKLKIVSIEERQPLM